MFSHLQATNVDKQRNEIMINIDDAYKNKVHHKVEKVEQRNVLLIGRTRTGKSTIKRVLVNPSMIPEDMLLASETKNATFESFIIDENNTVLNIIDTPGLFERSVYGSQIRDNTQIIRAIGQCIEREITKFHLVGFCISVESGINEEDIKAIGELIKFLGNDASKSSCLIITRCESKSEEQRKKLLQEIHKDHHFKPLADYFKQGIYFFGCLHRDSWINATNDLYKQFETIVSYREKLIGLLTKNLEPFMVQAAIISQLRQLVDEQTSLKLQIKQLQVKGQCDKVLIELYKSNSKKNPCGVQ